MKNIIVMAALVVSTTAFAADSVGVNRVPLGSGQPDSGGFEKAPIVDNAKVQNDVLHAPSYLPNHPTAATIYPRVVEVPCIRSASVLKCDGYSWTPQLGRAEYLFIKPVEVQPPKATKEVVTIPGPTIFVEVPAKPKKQ